MRVLDLLKDIVLVPADYSQVKIQGLCYDSRQLRPGDLFFAYPGLRVDARDFISQVIQHGAAGVVYENSDGYSLPAALSEAATIPVIGIAQLNQKIGHIAARFYQNPSAHLQVVGVTGTNGKTSVTQFIAQALSLANHRCAVMGTLGDGFLSHLKTTGYTTPHAVEVHKALFDCLAAGADEVAMEVSSHSLSQHRVAGVDFDIAVFTQLSRDHLDYHHTMQAYGATKARLFQWPTLKYAIYNGDDAFSQTLYAQHRTAAQSVLYTTQAGQKIDGLFVAAETIEMSPIGFTIQVNTSWGSGSLNVPLLGRFNISNVLAVLSVLCVMDISLSASLTALSQLQPVPGRMELVTGSDHQPRVIVDFAHSPDALKQVLLCIREHTRGKLWCVFGCGGDRDHGKRGLMGQIAEAHADHIVITSDNPRSESPDRIIQDIQSGLTNPRSPYVEPDRMTAIEYAIRTASPDDWVLVAGKGHEATQIVGNKIHPFSDIEIVRRLLTD